MQRGPEQILKIIEAHRQEIKGFAVRRPERGHRN